MEKLKNLKNTIVTNKAVIGQKVLQLGGVAVGAFIAGAVLTKTQTEAETVVIADGDVIIEETVTYEETQTKD